MTSNTTIAAGFLTLEADPSDIDEDAIVRHLARLIALCESRGLDLDLLMNSAWHLHTGEPEQGT